jgi:glucuronate isomerase
LIHGCQRWHNPLPSRQFCKRPVVHAPSGPSSRSPVSRRSRHSRDRARAVRPGAKAPIISPHGHTDPEWFATDAPWANATELLLAPDHYLFRMLYSQGVSLDALGVPRRGGVLPDTDPRAAWRTFAAHWNLFAGTPSAMWLGHVRRSLRAD